VARVRNSPIRSNEMHAKANSRPMYFLAKPGVDRLPELHVEEARLSIMANYSIEPDRLLFGCLNSKVKEGRKEREKLGLEGRDRQANRELVCLLAWMFNKLSAACFRKTPEPMPRPGTAPPTPSTHHTYAADGLGAFGRLFNRHRTSRLSASV
jgi:hypothetical protein